jgi:3-oxoacyl-[acyl-carrier-protein] synthase-1
MSSAERIVISGIGAVCGAGLTLESIWEAVETGRSSIGPIKQWEPGKWPVQVAAELLGVENRQLVEDRKLHKIISRTDLLGLYSAGNAIQQSGLLSHRDQLQPDAATHFNDRSGVIAGSGGGAYRNSYDYFPLLTVAEGDLQKFGAELTGTVNPMWLLRNLPNNVLCHVGIRYNFKGTNACVTNQCAGGAMAVAESVASIRAGEADRMVAVGHDAPIEPETMLHYARLGLLSRDTIKPFDKNRQGTVFGEGAAAFVLERQSDLANRGATALGEFLGSGCTTEATGILDLRPDGDGVSRAIKLALQDAGITPDAVGMIVAHGNGTRASDASEALAFHRVFGDNPPPITGFKWAFGHTIAASGTIDLALALIALRKGIVPGIATLKEKDSSLNSLPISSKPQTPRSDIALIVCRGFGGMNVALLIRGAGAPKG